MIDIRDHGGAYGGSSGMNIDNLPIASSYQPGVILGGDTIGTNYFFFHVDDTFLYAFVPANFTLHKLDKRTGKEVAKLTSSVVINEAIFDTRTNKIYFNSLTNNNPSPIRVDAETMTIEARSANISQESRGIYVDDNYLYVATLSNVYRYAKDFSDGDTYIASGTMAVNGNNLTYGVHLPVNNLLMFFQTAVSRATFYDLNTLTNLKNIDNVPLSSFYATTKRCVVLEDHGSITLLTVQTSTVRKIAIDIVNGVSNVIYQGTIPNENPHTVMKISETNFVLLGSLGAYAVDITPSVLTATNIKTLTYVSAMYDSKKKCLYTQYYHPNGNPKVYGALVWDH